MYPRICRLLSLWVCVASVATLVASAKMALTDFNGIVMDQAADTLLKLNTVQIGWNAMVASVDAIEGIHSEHKGVSGKVAAPGKGNQAFMIGLAHSESGAVAQDPSYSAITFAAQVSASNFWVFESGGNRGEFGEVHAGDVINVALNSETPPKIEYRVNGQIRYTSRKQVKFPLFVKISAHGQGPVLHELTWINTSSKSTGSATCGSERKAETFESNMEDRVQKLEDALRAATKERTELEVEMIQLQAENEELRRRIRC